MSAIQQVLIAIGASVPDAPTGVSCSYATYTSASVSFTAPTNNGGSTITQYTAISTPGSFTGTLNQAGSGTITVTGLTGNTAYTFTVHATNSVGNSAESSASAAKTCNNWYKSQTGEFQNYGVYGGYMLIGHSRPQTTYVATFQLENTDNNVDILLSAQGSDPSGGQGGAGGAHKWITGGSITGSTTITATTPNTGAASTMTGGYTTTGGTAGGNAGPANVAGNGGTAVSFLANYGQGPGIGGGGGGGGDGSDFDYGAAGVNGGANGGDAGDATSESQQGPAGYWGGGSGGKGEDRGGGAPSGVNICCPAWGVRFLYQS